MAANNKNKSTTIQKYSDYKYLETEFFSDVDTNIRNKEIKLVITLKEHRCAFGDIVNNTHTIPIGEKVYCRCNLSPTGVCISKMKQELYLGDCLELMDGINENTIDLVVTSPPYFNAKKYSYWEDYNSYLFWLESVFKKALLLLKPGRMCAVNLSVIIQPREKRNMESKRIPLPFHFVALMERIGFKFIEDILWIKPEGSAKNRNGRFYQDRQPIQYKPNAINEYILVFQKPMQGLIDKIVRSYSGEIKENSLIKDGYERTNVWYINPKTNSKHPAPFPEELSNKLITYYSYVGDVVLDMFAGSGTTAVSSKKLCRQFVLIEKDEIYYKMAMERLKNLG